MLAKNPALSPGAAYQLLRDTSAGDAGTVKRVDACAVVVTLVHQGLCHPVLDADKQPAEVREARFGSAEHPHP